MNREIFVTTGCNNFRFLQSYDVKMITDVPEDIFSDYIVVFAEKYLCSNFNIFFISAHAGENGII